MGTRDYHEAMARLAGRFLRRLILTLGICGVWVAYPQDHPARSIEISLPAGVNSESVYIRYVLAGGSFGGLVQARPGVSSYFVSTMAGERAATGIKALLYAPGCALQTLDVSLSGSGTPQYPFTCRPIPAVSISGTIAHPDRLYSRGATLQARYIARWAAGFLGLDDSFAPIIPVGEASKLSVDGSFQISVPDFSAPAGTVDRSEEFQIWAKDKVSGNLTALLLPQGHQSITTRMGGLKVLSTYPADIVFAPCDINSAQAHDAEGFALRPDIADTCSR
jgi:hypothetical protein